MPANRAARGRFQALFLGEPEALRRSFAQVDRETVEFNRKVDHGRARLARFGIGLTAALTALGAAARDVGQAAADAQTSDARLQAQMHALGLSYRHHIPRIQDTVQRLSRLAGLDDEDLQDAFTTILRTTGNVTESLRLLEVSTDLARAKHMEVTAAGQLVARVAGGNVGILRRYGIQIDQDATSAEALATLSSRFDGQAKAYGDSTKGAYDRYKVATENLSEAVGAHLLPAITDMALFGLKVLDRSDKVVHALADAAGDVRDWTRDTSAQVITGIRDTPRALEDAGKWMAGQLLAGVTGRDGVIRDGVQLLAQTVLDQIKAVFTPKAWLGVAGELLEAIVKGLGDLLVDKLIDLLGGAAKLLQHLLKDKALGGIGLGGAFGKDQVALWLTEALIITNHFSAANLKALYGRTMQESGGNPRAINLWDSNAKAGHPSKGLLQTIDSTFNTYHLPGYDDIWNPVDNAIAAIRYMFAFYGHIVGPSGSGYAAGGDLAVAGAFRFLAGEKGRERIQIRPLTPRTLVIRPRHVGSTLDAHQLAHHVAFLAA